MTTPEELKAEIERLKRENEGLKKLEESQEADNATSVRKLQELQTAAAAASRVNVTEKRHPNEMEKRGRGSAYPQDRDVASAKLELRAHCSTIAATRAGSRTGRQRLFIWRPEHQ